MTTNHTPELGIVDIIADGLDATTDGRGFNAEHLAAVRLATAAPDLLAACKAISTWLQGDRRSNDEQKLAIRMLIDAIAKAGADEARP